MRKSIKWTFIGLGIFIGAVIIIFVGLFISAGVSAIKEVSTPETKQVEEEQEIIGYSSLSALKSKFLSDLLILPEIIATIS